MMTAKETIVRNKTTLQDILCDNDELILEKVMEKNLITRSQHRDLNSINMGTVMNKICRLVDMIIGKGETICKAFVDLLQTDDKIKETFGSRLEEEIEWGNYAGTSRKTEEAPESKETVPCKNMKAAAGSNIVTEKQLMQVANKIGKTWKRIGTMLGIDDVKIQQIEENNQRDHVDRVYQMLLFWKRCQKKNATAAYLHSKLTELDADLVPDEIDFLLEED